MCRLYTICRYVQILLIQYNMDICNIFITYMIYMLIYYTYYIICAYMCTLFKIIEQMSVYIFHFI